MANSKERFIISHQEGPVLLENMQKSILVDIITGVNYLVLADNKGGIAITPLVNKNNEVLTS